MPGLIEGVRARHFEFDGSFGKGLEEIFVGDARAEQAGENPDQKNFASFPSSRSSGKHASRGADASEPSFPMPPAIASLGSRVTSFRMAVG